MPEEIALRKVTTDEVELIKRTIAKDATADELKLYFYDCQRQGVHPLDKLIHFTKRGGKYTPVTSIDFMRGRAADSGEYAGNDDAEFITLDGEKFPQMATVSVHRIVQGIKCAFTASARWSEYVQSKRDGTPTRFWNTMAHTMLDKCAEALAMRKAFPEDTAGLYVAEELQQMEGEPAGQLTGGAHSPHGDKEDYPNPETSEHYDSIIGRLATVRNGLDTCASYKQAEALRVERGSKANPQGSRLTRDMQAAREGNLVGFEGLKEMSKRWNHCDRQLAKLEAQYPKPETFEEDEPVDDPAEDFPR